MKVRAFTLGFIGLIVVGAWLFASGNGYAHAYLQHSFPGQDVTVESPIHEVTLSFTEPVEVNFSTFKVYAIEPGEDSLKTKAAASQLVADVLRRRDDRKEKARVDAGVTPARGLSAEVRIQFNEALDDGTYVVMWRVLSIDTHQTEGFYVFSVTTP